MTSKILIVGAGIAGLSLARRCMAYDLAFDIIEKRPSDYSYEAGVILPFNAVRELKKLKIFDRLSDTSHPFSKITYSTTSGRKLGIENLISSPFENDQFVAVRRQALWEALFKGLHKKVRFNTELLSIEHGDDHVVISCSNELLNGKYDLVVAADGINSAVRTKNYEGQETIVDNNILCGHFLVTYPDHGLQPVYMIGNAESFALYPLDENTLCCFMQVLDENDASASADDAGKNIVHRFSSYGGVVPEILSKLDASTILVNRLKSVTEPRFFDRRIAFVGDAANGGFPLIHQGVATALEDTRYLADSLAMQHIDQALESYNARRENEVATMRRYSDETIHSFKKARTRGVRSINNLKIRAFGLANFRCWRKLAAGNQFS